MGFEHCLDPVFAGAGDFIIGIPGFSLVFNQNRATDGIPKLGSGERLAIESVRNVF